MKALLLEAAEALNETAEGSAHYMAISDKLRDAAGDQFIQIPRKTLERWLKDLGYYWYSSDGDGGDEWNNDEIIEISREIERLLKGQK
jgi:hypothetical protein